MISVRIHLYHYTGVGVGGYVNAMMTVYSWAGE